VSRRNLGAAAEKSLLHRTMTNLHHFSTGEVVRPPLSTSPAAIVATKVAAFSAEELNNIYNLVNIYCFYFFTVCN
jgi:hypothetical protein